jgi:hypothetical protein
VQPDFIFYSIINYRKSNFILPLAKKSLSMAKGKGLKGKGKGMSGGKGNTSGGKLMKRGATSKSLRAGL